MDMQGIIWGAAILAGGGGVYGLYRLERKAKATAAAPLAAFDVGTQVQAAVASGLENLPRLVSDEIQRLEAEAASLRTRAEKAEADYAAEHEASVQRLQATGAAVAKTLADLGAMGAQEVAALAAQLPAPQPPG